MMVSFELQVHVRALPKIGHAVVEEAPLEAPRGSKYTDSVGFGVEGLGLVNVVQVRGLASEGTASWESRVGRFWVRVPVQELVGA